MPVFSKRIGYSALVPAIGASLLLTVSSADAAPIVNFDIDVLGATGGPYSNTFNQNGPIVAGSLGSTTPGEWSIDWGPFSADDDPGATGGDGVNLNSVFTVQNTHTSNLQFSILISMDVLPANASFYAIAGTNNLESLTAGNVTLSSTNAFGAGLPIWSFLVDGGTHDTLFPAPYSLSTSGTQAQSADDLGPMAGTPSNIGIRLVFDLSPGAEINFNGTFQYIPTPGALALLGLAGVIGRRRRR
jgi:uncharacterized protein (TIGR03382 family)